MRDLDPVLCNPQDRNSCHTSVEGVFKRERANLQLQKEKEKTGIFKRFFPPDNLLLSVSKYDFLHYLHPSRETGKEKKNTLIH